MFRALLAFLGVAADSNAHMLRTAVRKHRVGTGRAGRVGQAIARNEAADQATADLMSQVSSFQPVNDLRALTSGVIDRKPRP